MRQPQTAEQRWSWWERAIAGEDVPIHDSEPEAGFFAVRKFRYADWTQGPMLPAKIYWLPSEIDPETGELTADEKLAADIDGVAVDPRRTWLWLARRPISFQEYRWLQAQSPLLPKHPPQKA